MELPNAMTQIEGESDMPTETATTELADAYLGNVSESADVARRIMQAQREDRCLEVEISRGDRTKGRILTQTAEGIAVGITKERDWLLRDGDVLSTANHKFVLVSLMQQQVMALRFEPDVENEAIALLHLGHTLGNQHWPVTTQGKTLYVELVADAAQMKTTLIKMVDSLGIKGLQISIEAVSSENAMDFSMGHAH